MTDSHSPEIVYNVTNNCPLIADLKERNWERRGSDVLVCCLAVGGGQKVKRSGIGLQARNDGEDEVPERGVLSDEEAC